MKITMFLIFKYICIYNIDIAISVRPCMFVPKPDDMSEFVDDNTELVTILPKTYCLRSIATSANERATATRPFREKYIAFFVSPLDERHTRM